MRSCAPRDDIMEMRGRVLIVAGSDSGGGAGIQADIKAVTALGGFAMTAVTALTAQNTQGVFGIHAVPPEFVQQQMRLVLTDLGADCIKLGMLHSSALIGAVAAVIEADAPTVPLVVDPVMIAKGGAALLDPGALEALSSRLIARAALVTPNLPEAALLSGIAIASLADRRRAADAILARGARAVLIKGGHGDEDPLIDLLVVGDRATEFTSPRLHTRHTHGTGCTLASAIATGLAQGLELGAAIARARGYVHDAIRTAPGYGTGHGPLNHAVTVRD
jgi:hydroxymethylpyrimidine/phosphomethylpyrimidine kinase